MFFLVALYISLAIFALGTLYKVYTWMTYRVGSEGRNASTTQRLTSALKGVTLTILSLKILILIKSLILDVLFQRRILREDFLRWLMHMCIFGGFTLLLLMHALDAHITSALFWEYVSTINPFLFLRNIFFLLVMIGLFIALYRRLVLKVSRLRTDSRDYYAIAILAVIMLTGVFLEGSKIVSFGEYQKMVEEYGDSDLEDLRPLESYWVKNFGLVSPNVKEPFDTEILEQGLESHEFSCVDCHDPPQWAFLSYGVSTLMRPVALGLDRARIPDILLYIHFLACFIGLAYLPFSKFFHILSSPISLMTNAVVNPHISDEANVATKRIMELDACTRCKTCGLWCSVAVALDGIEYTDILPSERIETLKSIASKKNFTHEQMGDVWKGTYRCTLCGRCKEVCPVGIGLRDLWSAMREDLASQGYHPPILQVAEEAIVTNHNPIDYDNDERAMWVEFMDDPPDDEYQREKAEVIYFIGCVSSFSPAVQQIPEALCQILTKADVDFTILGEKEHCCGFPLLLAGMPAGVQELKRHNLETVREIGAKTIVFACPSCYHTWVHEYAAELNGVRLVHATEYVEELIKAGRLQFVNDIKGTVTFHDPCDLGRNSGVYSAPRQILKSIPGLNYVELSENGRKSLCCGGGGDVEMYDNEMTATIAALRANQIREAGADICATACQQCVRTLTTGVKNIDAKVEVLDVIQLVWRSVSEE